MSQADQDAVDNVDDSDPLVEPDLVVGPTKTKGSRVRQSAGLIPWHGDDEALEYLLGPDNHPWEP